MLNITHDNIKKYIEDAGSDCISAFGGTYDGGYHVQQNPNEFADLIYYLRQNKMPYNADYLEIGAAGGGASRILYELLNLKFITIIDNNLHPKHIYRKNNLKNIPHMEFIGDSHSNECYQFLKTLNKKYDLVFIDGDHSYNGVKQDTNLVLPYLKNKSKIIFHDTLLVDDVRLWSEKLKYGIIPGLKHIKDFHIRQGISLFEWR